MSREKDDTSLDTRVSTFLGAVQQDMWAYTQFCIKAYNFFAELSKDELKIVRADWMAYHMRGLTNYTWPDICRIFRGVQITKNKYNMASTERAAAIYAKTHNKRI